MVGFMRIVKVGGFYFAAGVAKLIGVKGRELLTKVLERFNEAQLVNPQMVFDWDVFDAALVNAVMAQDSGTLKARTITNEVLLRLAATTQFDDAVKKVGVGDEDSSALYFTASTEMESAIKAASEIVLMAGGVETELPPPSGDKLRAAMGVYGFSTAQVEAVQAKSLEEAVKLLILQKMATLTI
jgi:tRNA threonylcarbamoyladenosine modification (KEOPS) complex Cgi121 subunit